jgi:plasmid maintenance system antidote protein VapI
MPTQEWIRDLLKNKGRKLKDVAETLDISAPRVTDILKGAREVQSDEILKLANLLDLSANSLLESLSAGQLIDTGPTASPNRIKVEGILMGDGSILPLNDTHTVRSVAVPPDAETTEGLSCFIMGDDVLESEIKKGSIIIAADPRKHYFPMTPGAIFLIRREGDDISSNDNKDDEARGERLAPRQYHKTETGENWLIPLPSAPNPAYRSWRFELKEAPVNAQTRIEQNSRKETSGSEHYSETVYTDDIFAAVLWVHRRYMPS